MDYFKIMLIVHIIGGCTSLLVGLLILFFKKGDKRHILLGSIFFWSMLCSSIVSIPMSILHPNTFLLLIGIWTIYMLISGKRFLKIKNSTDVTKLDWVISFIMFIVAIVFIGKGLFRVAGGNAFGIVLVVFGTIGLLFVNNDIKAYRGKSKEINFGLMIHIQRMMGAFIASLTAFLVVNNTVLPSVVAWLLPTLFLVPLIVFWIRKWRKV
jgi:uncharacterized membrane protein